MFQYKLIGSPGTECEFQEDSILIYIHGCWLLIMPTEYQLPNTINQLYYGCIIVAYFQIPQQSI